ncbi:MAG: hypothetical protein KHZ15_09170 [Coprobacillus cateniformis]|uniref:hypothetical protein n=1 Tax=Longibaculum muris TaxID=1796628 RepID=UPI003AB7A649|nr:hypothetical protein [Coprobacillus cateniformis]
MKLFKKLGLCMGIAVPVLFATVNVDAYKLSASKELKSSNYSGAYCNTTATASCDTVGSFNWTTSVKDSRKSTTSYLIYRLGDYWTKNNSTKKAVYNWKYTVSKLSTGASGGSTTVSNGSGTATFTYNASTKKLTVQ